MRGTVNGLFYRMWWSTCKICLAMALVVILVGLLSFRLEYSSSGRNYVVKMRNMPLSGIRTSPTSPSARQQQHQRSLPHLLSSIMSGENSTDLPGSIQDYYSNANHLKTFEAESDQSTTNDSSSDPANVFRSVDLQPVLTSCQQAQSTVFHNVLLWKGDLYCTQKARIATVSASLSQKPKNNTAADNAGAQEFMLTTPWLSSKGKGPRISIKMHYVDHETQSAREHFPSQCTWVAGSSALVGTFSWGQFGHFVYNTLSLLFELTGMLSISTEIGGSASDEGQAKVLRLAKALREDVRLMVYPDMTQLEPEWVREAAAWDPVANLTAMILEGFSLVSKHPIWSLPALLQRSQREAICLERARVGLYGARLDHYNKQVTDGDWRTFHSALASHFDAQPVPRCKRNATSIIIINRASRRRILNGKEVADLSQKVFNASPAYPAISAVQYLEGRTFSEQIRMMASNDVLIGMDGTGLFNGNFMPYGSTVIRVKPYALDLVLPGKSGNFKRYCCTQRLKQQCSQCHALQGFKPTHTGI